ncbi:MAG: DUF4397 domain-containing protein [Kofleriaceae bacterium]
MRRFTSLMFLSTAILAVACGDEDDPDPPGETARIRVVHASAGAPAVDVYAEGVATPLIADLAYGEASAYVEVAAGSYNLQVRAAGAPATDAPVYETGAVALAADATVTAVAAGVLGSTSADEEFRVLALAEAFDPAASGEAQVRVVHASADAPTVGVDVGNDDPAAPEVASLARFADTGAAGIGLPAGAALQLGITAGGATVTAFTTPALPAGADLFVIALGRLADLPRQDSGFALLAVGPAGVVGRIDQNPVVYALHASPDAPDVDIREASSDGLLIGALPYGGLDSVQVPPGSYTLDFYGAGSPAGTPAASATTPALAAGQRYLAVATGFLSPVGDEPGFQLIAVADEFALDDPDARLRAIHASPDAPAVDIGTAVGFTMDAPVLIEDAAFGDATAGAGLSVPAAALTLGVAAANAPTAVATFGVTTTAGLRAFAVATGALSPAGDEAPFALTVVDTTASPWTVAALAPSVP